MSLLNVHSQRYQGGKERQVQVPSWARARDLVRVNKIKNKGNSDFKYVY